VYRIMYRTCKFIACHDGDHIATFFGNSYVFTKPNDAEIYFWSGVFNTGWSQCAIIGCDQMLFLLELRVIQQRPSTRHIAILDYVLKTTIIDLVDHWNRRRSQAVLSPASPASALRRSSRFAFQSPEEEQDQRTRAAPLLSLSLNKTHHSPPLTCSSSNIGNHSHNRNFY
jgi:hypothetical protein